MSDVIDSDGFRANVGIVLMRGAGRGFPRPAHGRARLAVSAGRHAQRRDPRAGAVSGAPRGDRARAGRRRARRADRRAGCATGCRHATCAATSSRCASARSSAGFCCGCRRDDEVRLRAHREPEFDQWRWANFWEPVREVIYFKRPVYSARCGACAAGFSARPAAVPGLVGRGDRARRRSRPRVGGLSALSGMRPLARCSASKDGTPQVVRPRAPRGASRSRVAAGAHRPVRAAMSFTSSAATTPATTAWRSPSSARSWR